MGAPFRATCLARAPLRQRLAQSGKVSSMAEVSTAGDPLPLNLVDLCMYHKNEEVHYIGMLPIQSGWKLAVQCCRIILRAIEAVLEDIKHILRTALFAAAHSESLNTKPQNNRT